jgi:hypothetical protein
MAHRESSVNDKYRFEVCIYIYIFFFFNGMYFLMSNPQLSSRRWQRPSHLKVILDFCCVVFSAALTFCQVGCRYFVATSMKITLALIIGTNLTTTSMSVVPVIRTVTLNVATSSVTL